MGVTTEGHCPACGAAYCGRICECRDARACSSLNASRHATQFPRRSTAHSAALYVAANRKAREPVSDRCCNLREVFYEELTAAKQRAAIAQRRGSTREIMYADREVQFLKDIASKADART